MSRSHFPETLAALSLVAYVALSGCASDKAPPSPVAPPPHKPLSGEQILRESEGMAQLGKRYQQGEAMVRQGDELVRQGQAKIAEGEKLIEQGKAVMQESEQGYGALKK
jgi:hypothetical protein